MEERPDSELVVQAQAGDKYAFGILIERYQQMVRRIAAGMVADKECARELAQEAILQAYLSLDHLRDITRFKSWLYGITLNICRSYLRERREDVSLELLIGGMHGTSEDFAGLFSDAIDPQAVVEARELHQMVLRAVQSLSERDRVTTLMFYYEQLSIEEIAAILKLSPTAVKGRLHRARKQLRQRLAPMYADSRAETAQQVRRKAMIKATINSIRVNTTTQQRVVILQDEGQRRALFIWIHEAEAFVIAAGLHDITTPRPMTAHLMANILKATGTQVTEVRIEALKDEIFYAVVKVRNGDTEHEIDARPSDALSLAVLLDSPIYIAEEVMERAGLTVPEGKRLRDLDESEREFGRENVLKRIEEIKATRLTTPRTSEERIEDFYKNFVDLMMVEDI
jgi:RNA polymerase sigma factor (sigma-70 family)